MIGEGIIYLITNTVNNKKYIGVTSRSLEIRIKDHIRYAYAEKTLPLYKEINEFTWQAFSVEIIEKVPLEELGQREKHWIAYYKTILPSGYNTVSGGWGYSGSITADEIGSMKEMFYLGYTIEDIAFEFNRSTRTISELLYSIGIDREERRQNNENNRGFPVFSIDSHTKELTKYPSITEAAKVVDVTFRSLEEAIEKSWNCRGFYWKMGIDLMDADIECGYYSGELVDLKQKKAEEEGIPVLQFDLSMKLLYQDFSFGKAAKRLNRPNGGTYISKATKSGKAAYGFYWKTRFDYEAELEKRLASISLEKLLEIATKWELNLEKDSALIPNLVKEYLKRKINKKDLDCITSTKMLK